MKEGPHMVATAPHPKGRIMKEGPHMVATAPQPTLNR